MKVWKSNLKNHLKVGFFRATVESVLLYGAECWTMTGKMRNRLDGTYTRMLRAVLGVSWKEHKTNKGLYGNLPKITDTLMIRRLRFIGHCSLEISKQFRCIQLFRERLSEKKCRRQSRKVIWDMINTLFLTLWLLNLLLLLSFSTRKHTSMASLAILSNFFEEQRTQNHPQYLSRLSRTTFLEIAVCIWFDV